MESTVTTLETSTMRQEKTVVLGPVRTSLGPDRDSRYVALYFI